MKLFQVPEDVAFNVAANAPSADNILNLSADASFAADNVLNAGMDLGAKPIVQI